MSLGNITANALLVTYETIIALHYIHINICAIFNSPQCPLLCRMTDVEWNRSMSNARQLVRIDAAVMSCRDEHST